MKKLLLLLSLILTSQAYATGTYLGNISLSGVNTDSVGTTIMNQAVKVSVKDLKCRPAGYEREDVCFLRTVASKTFKVEALKVENDQLIYKGTAGHVVCGNYGVSRVLRRRTLFLTGNCQVETKIESAGRNSVLVVNFVTR